MSNVTLKERSVVEGANLGFKQTVSAAQQAPYIATLVSAFISDPVIRWMYPDAEAYLQCFPQFIKAFCGKAFEQGTIFKSSDNNVCAIWLAPHSEPDGATIEAVLADTVEVAKQDDLFAVIADMEAAHPDYAHWYLPWFGVDTCVHGRGYGSQFMQQCLDQIDGDNLPAYLETPNPKAIPFYQRHGFEVLGATQHGACPVVTFMERAPIDRK